MTSALALRTGYAPPAQPIRTGGGTAVRTAAGAVIAAFSLDSFDRHHRFAVYALRVANNTRKPLLCRIWIVSYDGSAAQAYPKRIEIAPYCERTADVPIWLDDCAPFSRALAEIAGDGVECIVEASAPPVERRQALPASSAPPATSGAAWAAIAGVSVAVVAVAAYAISLTAPRIGAFAVPPMAISGTTVRAEYSVTGTGRLSYDVDAPDGRRLAGGTLHERSGAIPIALPNTNGDGAYAVQLMLSGPFGTAKETRVLNFEPRGRDAAAITGISVDPIAAKPGQMVTVTYNASGTSGYVRLLGRDGTIWAQRPFSHGGKASFVVPPVSDSREMRVLLHVSKGRTNAESSAGLVVAAAMQAAAKPAAPASDAGAADATGAGDGGANGTFALLTPRVPSGGTIRVKILSPRNGMRVSLNDGQSHEVSGVNIGADQETVTLHAPSVSLATRYTVVASFTDGFGQESIVEPVTVAP